MTNTIAYRPDLLGRKSYDSVTDRASSFDLELFNIDEDWDEGSGYDFVYNDELYPLLPLQAANWYDKKTNEAWFQEGAYISGSTSGSTIIGNQHFVKGNENLEIDITDYVNHLLQLSGATGYTGTSFGLGLKFTDDFEMLETTNRQAVAFHTKYTNTFYEPFY
ncbi:MAG: hypothetical protein HC836_28010 [Richelia sp. RM2_1_2]|nr:hypothetical protein [Richelia sp. RM2_1_2]